MSIKRVSSRTRSAAWSTAPLHISHFKARITGVLVYSFVPLCTAAAFLITQIPPIKPSHINPPAAVLPLTGAVLPAQQIASISGGVVDHEIKRPFDGGTLTTAYSRWHPGIDVAVANGTPLEPVMDGVVTEAQSSIGGYGNTVVVTHEDGTYYRYAHMSQRYVNKGDYVTTDTIIGTVGSTGRSTGPHLHLELAMEAMQIDPLSILP